MTYSPSELVDRVDTDLEKAGVTALAFEDAYMLAQITGDVSELRSLSGPDCALCAEAISEVQERAARGERLDLGVEGATHGLYAASPDADSGAEYFSALLYVERGDGAYLDAADAPVETVPAARYAIYADVEEVDGQWRLVQFVRTSWERADELAAGMTEVEWL